MPTLISSDVNGYFKRLGQGKENNRGVLGAEEKLVIIWGMTKVDPIIWTGLGHY